MSGEGIHAKSSYMQARERAFFCRTSGMPFSLLEKVALAQRPESSMYVGVLRLGVVGPHACACLVCVLRVC